MRDILPVLLSGACPLTHHLACKVVCVYRVIKTAIITILKSKKEQVQRNAGRFCSAIVSLRLLFIAVTVSFHIRLQNGFVFALWTEP